MFFGLSGEHRDGANLAVRERRLHDFGDWNLDGLDPFGRVRIEMLRSVLADNFALNNLSITIHTPSVRITFAGNQPHAETIDGRDDNQPSPTGHRISTESHARHVGIDHALNEDRRRGGCNAQSMFAAISKDAFAKTRTPDRNDTVQNVLAPNIQKAVQLTRERETGAVFIGGRRANRHKLAIRTKPDKGFGNSGSN